MDALFRGNRVSTRKRRRGVSPRLLLLGFGPLVKGVLHCSGNTGKPMKSKSLHICSFPGWLRICRRTSALVRSSFSSSIAVRERCRPQNFLHFLRQPCCIPTTALLYSCDGLAAFPQCPWRMRRTIAQQFWLSSGTR